MNDMVTTPPLTAHTASELTPPPAAGTPLLSPTDTTAPAIAPSVADKKRLKHREYVKKSYNKKINTIETLKHELDLLETQYTALLRASPPHAPTPLDNSDATTTALTHVSLLRRYKQLADVKRRLQLENDALYQTNAQHMKLEGRMHQLLQTDAQLPHIPSPYRITQPLPSVEYATLIATARDDILRFMHSPHKLSSGARVFGWTDQRKIQNNVLKFALEKHFRGISAFDLLQKSWAIFSSPMHFPLVYSPTLHVAFYELQRVNDDTVLFYRTIEADGSQVCVKTVFLLARVTIAEGFMLLFKSIDPTRVGFTEDPVHAVVHETTHVDRTTRQSVWVDKYIWVIFKDVGHENACVFHFGGSTTTAIWLKEVLFIALKWEAMAVGPLITLTM